MTDMTDLNAMTKEAINVLLAVPLTASQLKKVSKADLIAKFDAMPASDALEADLRDARADETPPTAPATRKPRTLEDRVIQKPADDFKHVKAVQEGTKRHILIKALETGATMDDLIAALGWSRDVVSSALRYDLGQMGLGCERKAGRYFLLLPKQLRRVAVKAKGQAAGEVLLAACKS